MKPRFFCPIKRPTIFLGGTKWIYKTDETCSFPVTVSVFYPRKMDFSLRQISYKSGDNGDKF